MTEAPLPNAAQRPPAQLRVYRLLADGASIPKAARLIGITRQAAHHHAKALLAMGAIAKVPGPRSPLLFRPGPRAAQYESRASSDATGRVVPPPLPPLAAARVHGGSYRVGLREVRSRLAVPWSREWVTHGAPHARVHHVVAGKTFRIVRSGKRRAALVAQPLHHEWTADPGELKAMRERRLREASAALRDFARTYGFVLEGRVTEVQAPEGAFPVPGAGVLGQAGRGAAWIDESPKRGRPELESRDPSVLAAVADLPGWREDVDAWRAAREAAGRRAEEEQRRLLAELTAQRAVLEEHTVLLQGQVRATLEVAEAQRAILRVLLPPSREPEASAGPGPPGPEVA